MGKLEEKYPKTNPFSVPDGYFECLERKIMQRVVKEKGKRLERRQRHFRLMIYGTAAVAVVLICIQILLPHGSGNGTEAGGDTGILASSAFAEDRLDEHFNPSGEEIIEYLATETGSYEIWMAGIYD